MELINNMALTLSAYKTAAEHLLSDKNELPVMISGLAHIHKAHFLAALCHTGADFPLLVMCDSESEAVKLCEDVNTMTKSNFAFHFPASDMMLTDTEAQSKEYVYKRIAALWAATEKRARLVIFSAEAAVQLTIPKDVLTSSVIRLLPGDEINTASLAADLIRAGYTRCDMIEGKGQFSVRGALVDIYPVNMDYPVRIELWGDEIDTISSFNIISQRRIDTVKGVSITPCDETVISDKAGLISDIEKILAKCKRAKKPNENCIQHLERDISFLKDGVSLYNPYIYFPLCYKRPGSIFDYGNKLILCESFNAVQNGKGSIAAHLEDLKLLTTEGILTKGLDRYMLTKAEFEDNISSHICLYFDNFIRGGGIELSKAVNVESVQLSAWTGEYKLLKEELSSYMAGGYSCLIFAGTQKGAKTLAGDLRSDGLPADYYANPSKLLAKKIYVTDGILSAGLEYIDEKISVMTAFSGTRQKTKAPSKHKRGGDIHSLNDISPGDIVVHDSYGIGIFSGIIQRTYDNVTSDYIVIKYAGTDMLYMPVTQLDLISRYIGSGDADTIKLSSFKSDNWKKSKARAKSAAKEMAQELIDIYSKRMKSKGFMFDIDNEQQSIFENHFSYIETDDQLRCIEEIKHDMMSAVPMERLLCGDVGFGKTEVALRAAFKCVQSGKQCAILVPTTVLAWQHYQTVLRRMEGFNVKAELLSRFRTPKEQKAILKKLEEGDIDIIIGTHRLVQKDVNFFDLGLVIIDEEQRFGVNHKEKFKESYPGVDVLTLSATPIPRTLNMAMSGIRDMSVIETPPGDRQPVTTYVTEFDYGIIAQAINKELRRNGQVYYIHNRIESIYGCAAKLEELIPEAKIGIAHGRMSEDELLDIWTKLIDGEINLLVCTTLIETGVDVPNVNTLIIEDADRMGLAQLHQLRGRVGRTNRRAYAYFTYRRGKELSEIATKRLDAIREFTRFGAGFRVAMKDLEIRGAGSVLGQSQSGHLSSVGYDMYIKLLNEAVLEQQGKKVEITPECLVDVRVNAFIPDSYITNQTQRIECYRKIAAISDDEGAMDVTDELIDRYGDVPDSVVNLITVARLRHKAQRLLMSEITEGADNLIIYPMKDNERAMMILLAAGGELGKNAVVSLIGKPCIKIPLEKGKKKNTLSVLERVLDIMENAVKGEGENGQAEKP